MTGFVHNTGQDPREVKDSAGWLRYVQRTLGLGTPVGRQRIVLQKRIKDEMEAQDWTWGDLTKATRYVKRFKSNETIHSPFFILYFVREAKKWEEETDTFELQTKVAAAMTVETDPAWLRRLALAKGKALEKVYQMWEEERGEA